MQRGDKMTAETRVDSGKAHLSRTRRLRWLAAGGMTASLELVASVASAQTSAANVNELEEILVTARKVEENLQSVPVAVTAFTGEQLARQNAVRLSDVARLTPGLMLREGSNNPTGLIIGLRAQVQTDQLATLDPSVGAYVDGFYWARAYGLNTDLVDLKSVQVLKGPQGTLFGRNTTGGAVLMETNDPSSTALSAMGQVSYGRFNERILTGVLNAPIVADRLAVRVALQNNKRDGYLEDFISRKKYSNRNNFTGRVKLGAQLTDNVSIVLSGEQSRMETRDKAQSLVFLRQPVVTSPTQPAFSSVARTFVNMFPIPGLNVDDYMARARADHDYISLSSSPTNVPYTKVRTETFTGTVKYDSPIGTLKWISGYRKVRALSNFDLDGSPWEINYTGSLQSLKNWSTELQLTGNALSDRVQYAIGTFYFEESGFDSSLGYQVPGLNFNSNQFYGDIDNKSVGAYAQTVTKLSDAVNLTTGIRYSTDRKGIETRNLNFDRRNPVPRCFMATAVAPLCSLSRSDKFSDTSYTAGLDYKPTDDVLLYVKTSKGFRSGGQNLRATSVAAFVPFLPETVREHEAGAKTQLFDRRLRLNVAAYRSTLKGAQRSTLVPTATGSITTILGNAARVRVWGMEAEATAILFNGFEAAVTGSLTKPKYVRYSEAPSAQNPTGDRTNERFDGVSEASFSVAGTYRRDLSFGELMVRADYSWSDSTPANSWNNPLDPNNADIIRFTTAPSGGVVNARVALNFADRDYEIAAWVRNLTDNRDLVNAQLVDPVGYLSNRFREPRTYGVTFTARLGPH